MRNPMDSAVACGLVVASLLSDLSVSLALLLVFFMPPALLVWAVVQVIRRLSGG